MLEKTWEYWAVIAGMAVYIARNAEGEPAFKRMSKIAAAALLAIGLSAELAAWFHISEIVATVLIMGFGQLVLDVLTAILKDREFVKDIIKSKFGDRQ